MVIQGSQVAAESGRVDGSVVETTQDQFARLWHALVGEWARKAAEELLDDLTIGQQSSTNQQLTFSGRIDGDMKLFGWLGSYKRCVTRGLKIGGLILAIGLGIKLAAHVKLLLIQRAPLVASDDARREEERREIDFLTQTEGSATMARTSCPQPFGWPTRPTGRFLHAAQIEALSDHSANQHDWKLVCGYVYDSAKSDRLDEPGFVCAMLHELIGWKDIEGAGYTCLDGDGSFGNWPHQWKVIPDWLVTTYTDGYGKPTDGSNIGNIRLKVEKCFLDASHEGCLVTMWVTRKRSSWGKNLVAEYTARIRVEIVTFLVIVTVGAAVLIFSVIRFVGWCRRRIAKVSANCPAPSIRKGAVS